MGGLRLVSASEARACFAALITPERPGVAVGEIRLREHQVEAVERIAASIARYGGALLCDPVGTGKTFIALALASRYESATVVAPAVLKNMWLAASARTAVPVRFISHEALSRARSPQRVRGLVIVDEAHHARNPSTKRYRSLSRLVQGSDVLLATATPVHNDRRDLVALQSLYLGQRAPLLEPSELADTVIRRDHAVDGIPRMAPIEWISTVHDDRLAERILELPPSLPVRDGGTAERLVRHSLVRQWASSDAALRTALKRRLQRAASLIAALEAGRYPSRDELSAWVIGDDAVQLAFPEMVTGAPGEVSDLLPVVRLHAQALERILAILSPHSERDAAAALEIRRLAERHRGIPVVAFSAYEETVSALYRGLVRFGGAAALTGRRGNVAGGRITRREILERFAPIAAGCPPPSPANRVSLLLTTDLLSEGVNLQDAGVVMHIDLPFTNARLEQRAGRVARIGSPHEEIHSYAFRPPARAETIARIEKLLGVKLSFELDARAIPRLSAEVMRRVGGWRGGSPEAGVATAVESERDGFLAVVGSRDECRLIAGSKRGISDDPAEVLRAIDCAEGAECCATSGAIERCQAAIAAHLALEASLDGSLSSRSRRKLHNRINQAVAQAPLHERARIVALAERARETADRGGGAELEACFASLLERPLEDDDFLDRLASLEFTRCEQARRAGAVLALILFVARST
jgi:hypothetical protein